MTEMHSLMTKASQIFCGTLTTLGFSSGINKATRLLAKRLLESDMKTEQVLKSFMVDLDYDSKNSSMAWQALDMVLRLVAPEHSYTPWNRSKE